MKVGGRLHFVLFHKFICGNSWKKGVRHHDFYSELVLRGVGHGCFYFILAGLLPPLVAPHGDHCFAAVNRSARAQSCPVLNWVLEPSLEVPNLILVPNDMRFSRQIHDNSMVAGSVSLVAIR